MNVEANQTCPKCGSDNVQVIKPGADKNDRRCHDCKVMWKAASR